MSRYSQLPSTVSPEELFSLKVLVSGWKLDFNVDCDQLEKREDIVFLSTSSFDSRNYFLPQLSQPAKPFVLTDQMYQKMRNKRITGRLIDEDLQAEVSHSHFTKSFF